MVVMDQNRVAWRYTRDNGSTHYRISAKNDYVIQVNGSSVPKQGGQAAASSIGRIPKEIKPRMVKMTGVANPGIVRWLVCYDQTCDLWTTPGTTFNMAVNGASLSMQSTDITRGEKRRDTTTQSA